MVHIIFTSFLEATILLMGMISIDDLKILYNDWPYGLEKGIVHLVIWTKFELEEDPATGLLTESMWKKIDDYVGRVFRSRIPADQVRFKFVVCIV